MNFLSKLSISFVSVFLIWTAGFSSVKMVTSLSDANSPGTFRYEVTNALTGDTVLVNVKGTVSVTSTIIITKGVTVIGPAPIHFILDGNTTGATVLRVNLGGGGIICNLSGMSFTNATFSAIEVFSGDVNISRCLFENNMVSGSGGAIKNTGGSNVSISACSFINNKSSQGGAISNESGICKIVNSTFYQNNSTTNGGAIYNLLATLFLTNNTFYLNTASGVGGAVQVFSGSIVMRNNIVYQCSDANNFALTNTSGTWISGWGNVIDQDLLTMTFWPVGGGDNIGTNVNPLILLTPWIDGFGLKYFPIESNSSPAINVGGNSGLPKYDARLSYRVLEVGGQWIADAGAVEYSRHTVRSNSGNGASVGGLGQVLADLNSSFSPPYSVVFELPSPNYTISASLQYWVMLDHTTINGYSQMGSSVAGPGIPGNTRTEANPIVEVDGSTFGLNIGFKIDPGAAGSVLCGLTINGYNKQAIDIQGDSAHVEGNHIGTDITGLTALPNGTGVAINSYAVQIGTHDYYPGSSEISSNVISGNFNSNILILSGFAHVIQGNLIGTDAKGLGIPTSSPVNMFGIEIDSDGSFLIGGDRDYQRNIISGNSTGIGIIGDAIAGIGSKIIGNYIGLDYTGLAAIPNGDGIMITSGVDAVQIGGLGMGETNIIAGNNNAGINLKGSNCYVWKNFIGLNKTGIAALGNVFGVLLDSNCTGNQIGGINLGNVISGNSIGIESRNSSNSNIIYGNIIGLDSAGISAVANNYGVVLESNAIETIGGTSIYPSMGNVISGNTTAGIHVLSTCATAGINIYGNIVGLQADGISAVTSNSQDGIILEGTSGVVVGNGTAPVTGGGNIISGNNTTGKYGVKILGNNHQIESNWIGINNLGNPVGNDNGIYISGSNNYVKGTTNNRQVISGNIVNGVELNLGAANNTIYGNFIGTDVLGNIGYGNGVGILLTGGSNNNLVGGQSIIGPENLISGNTVEGIRILDPTTSNNQIVGNFIGTNINGSIDIANNYGVAIIGADSNLIGSGGGLFKKNVISGNTLSGILVTSGSVATDIVDNYIGIDTTGMYAVPNGNGIEIDGSSFTNVGDATLNYGRNVISGNNGTGISLQNSANHNNIENCFIGVDKISSGSVGSQQYGIRVISGANNNQIGNVGIGGDNVISGNSSAGIYIGDATTNSNYIENNIIGLNNTKLAKISNGNGIELYMGTHDNFVGGNWSAWGNIISGNSNVGIYIDGSDNNGIEGNIIGPSLNGSTALIGTSNAIGIFVDNGANSNWIGGDTLTSRNIISGNSSAGIVVKGSDSTYISGNFIGTGRNGTSALPNGTGIALENGSYGTIIGGTGASNEMNVISGNTSVGIFLNGTTLPIDFTGIYNNRIGTGPAGLTPLPNVGVGIQIYNSSNTEIGGIGSLDGNVISANNVGVEITGANSVGTLIQGNKIGVNSNGYDPLNAMGNTNEGVHLLNGPQYTQIGGDAVLGEGNVFGSNYVGVGINNATYNDVKGNNIGIALDGITSIPNTYGVLIISGTGSSNNNTVGGLIANNEGNFISTNTIDQVMISDLNTNSNYVIGNTIGIDVSNTPVSWGSNGVYLWNCGSNFVGGIMSTDKNIIGGCDTAVVLNGATLCYVTGNMIGLDSTGIISIGNTYGIALVNGATNNQIGSVAAGEKNIISGNSTGVFLTGAGTFNNAVEGNYIGTDITGTGALGNSFRGVNIVGGANGNLIGPANVISATTNIAVSISDVGTNSNSIEGNFIGTNASGNVSSLTLANGASGISISNFASGNNIGTSGSGNVICNNLNGIELLSNSNNTYIVSNKIGVGANGTTVIPNSQDGISIVNSDMTDVGDTVVGLENIISGNSGNGIAINNPITLNYTYIVNNKIGVDATSSPASNGGIGISIDSNTHNVEIGDFGFGNEIAFNDFGVMIGNVGSVNGVALIENSIHDNTNMGIDIGNDGATANDVGDVDSGDNDKQNFPVITAAFSSGPNLTVIFDCDFIVGNTYYIQIYEADASTPNPEGKTFNQGGFVTITAANQTAGLSLGASLPIGTKLVATATDTLNWITSEFSPSFLVAAPPAPPVIAADQTLCIGDIPAALTSSVPTGTLVWYTGGGIRLDTGMTYTPIIILPSTYTYYAVDSIFGFSTGSSNSLTIIVNPLPIATDSTVTVCSDIAGGSSATVDLTAIESGITSVGNTVTWYSDIALSILIAPSAYSVVTGTQVYALVSNGSCQDTAVITFIVNSRPDLSIASYTLNAESCLGLCDGSITYGGLPSGPPQIWSWDGGAAIYSNSATSLCSGVHTTLYTDINGCASDLISNTLISPSAITLPGAPTVTNITCFGASDGTATIGAPSGGTPGYTYQWYDSASTALSGQTSQTASGLSAGSYYVTVSDANSCSINSLLVTIIEPAIITENLSGINVTCGASCDGSISSAPTGGTGAITVSYYDAASTASSGTSLCAGWYYGIAIDFAGCSVTDSVLIIEPTPITSNIISFTNLSCNGVCDGSITVSASGGGGTFFYDWVDSLYSSTGQTSSVATGLCAESYYCIVSDGSCYDTTFVTTLTEPVPVTAPVTITDVSCFGFSDGSLIVDLNTAGGISPFMISTDGGFTYGIPNTGIQTWSGISGGTIMDVTIKDLNGCHSDTVSYVFTNPPQIFPNISGVDITCNGACDGSLSASPSGGTGSVSYGFFNDVSGTATSDSSLCIGWYYATATDSMSCTATDSVFINEPAPLIISSTATDVNCGQSDGTITITVSGGVTPFTFYLNGLSTLGGSPNTFTALNVGNYSSYVVDLNGCTSNTLTDTIISVGGVSALVGSINNVDCFNGNTGSATANTTTGLLPFNYEWTSPGGYTSTSQTMTGAGVGVYQVIVTDASGCKDTVFGVTIVGPPSGVSYTVTVTNPKCNGDTGAIQISAPSGGWGSGYSYAVDASTFTSTTYYGNLSPGFHDVSVMDSTCGYSQSVNLIDPPVVSYTATLTNPECDSLGGVINLTASGGNGIPYVYSLDTGITYQLTGYYAGLPAGTYLVAMSDIKGCFTFGIETLIQLPTDNCTKVSVNNVFSPDGDGVNDQWIIENIDLYPNNKVIIFNRWGDDLITFNNYDNSTVVWDGKDSGGIDVLSGTFYYIIEIYDIDKQFTGWVQVMR